METKTTIYEELSQAIREHDDFNLAYKQLVSEVALCTLGLDSKITLSFETQKKLVESAAVFSLSQDDDKEYALKILNGLLVCENSQKLHSAIKLILIRLGNFPTANKILDTFNYIKKDITELDFGLRSEVVTKYLSNQFSDEIMLTDFQADLLGKLNLEHSDSVNKCSQKPSSPESVRQSLLIAFEVLQ